MKTRIETVIVTAIVTAIVTPQKVAIVTVIIMSGVTVIRMISMARVYMAVVAVDIGMNDVITVTAITIIDVDITVVHDVQGISQEHMITSTTRTLALLTTHEACRRLNR
jgi:hypothetical protein